MVYDYLIDLDLKRQFSWDCHYKLSNDFRGFFVRNFKCDFLTNSVRYVLHLPKPLSVPVLADILGIPTSCITLCRDVHTAINFLNFN